MLHSVTLDLAKSSRFLHVKVGRLFRHLEMLASCTLNNEEARKSRWTAQYLGYT
jgi:hypothetical protein